MKVTMLCEGREVLFSHQKSESSVSFREIHVGWPGAREDLAAPEQHSTRVKGFREHLCTLSIPECCRKYGLGVLGMDNSPLNQASKSSLKNA